VSPAAVQEQQCRRVDPLEFEPLTADDDAIRPERTNRVGFARYGAKMQRAPGERADPQGGGDERQHARNISPRCSRRAMGT
jgi:hypothetical protein